MNKHELIYDYVSATIQQQQLDQELRGVLARLDSNNYVCSVGGPMSQAYTETVRGLVGRELWDWVQWWMWEADFGKKPLEFCVGGVWYSAADMTLFRFLEIVDVH